MIRDDLPGAELVIKRLADLSVGVTTIEALLVSWGRHDYVGRASRFLNLRSRIRRWPFYEILENEERRTAHSRYNSFLRRLVSFERAIECVA